MNQDLIIKELKVENQKLQDEIVYLKSLLDNAGIKYNRDKRKIEMHLTEISLQEQNANTTTITRYTQEERQRIIDSRIEIFMKLFCGRIDVFARRFVSKKTGISGYAPVCANFWSYSLCPKSNGKKVKCFECSNRNWIPLSKEVIYKHLVGEKEDCTDVVGVYPMLHDETCKFLVFDFDNHDKDKNEDVEVVADLSMDKWKNEVCALRKICAANGVDAIVERSRSGNGAHVWIFLNNQ